jgi:hypothetical protein
MKNSGYEWFFLDFSIFIEKSIRNWVYFLIILKVLFIHIPTSFEPNIFPLISFGLSMAIKEIKFESNLELWWLIECLGTFDAILNTNAILCNYHLKYEQNMDDNLNRTIFFICSCVHFWENKLWNDHTDKKPLNWFCSSFGLKLS